MDMEKFSKELKLKSGVDGEKAWNLVESWYTRDGRARRLSLHDLHELSQVIAKGLKHIRAEARAELAKKIVEWPEPGRFSSPYEGEAETYWEIVEYCEAILADEPKGVQGGDKL